MHRFDTRFLHIRKLLLFNCDLIKMMTSASLNPVFSLISSKVIRSAQAAQITQLSVPRIGSGFLTLVIGVQHFDLTIK